MALGIMGCGELDVILLAFDRRTRFTILLSINMRSTLLFRPVEPRNCLQSLLGNEVSSRATRSVATGIGIVTPEFQRENI